MLRVLRITLIWLVALAVPVQGFAAVAMFGCGPGHHSTTGAPAPGVAMDKLAGDLPQHSHAGHSDLHADHDHAGAADADHAQVLKAHGTSGKAGESACSPCASCCVVAALPATMVVFQPVPLVDLMMPFAPRGIGSFLTEGPERPPRSILV